MMLRWPVGGKAAVELAREAALCEAARAAVLLSCTEACRAASARQSFSRPLVPRVSRGRVPCGHLCRCRCSFTPSGG
jgi:hypothetical protein